MRGYYCSDLHEAIREGGSTRTFSPKQRKVIELARKYTLYVNFYGEGYELFSYEEKDVRAAAAEAGEKVVHTGWDMEGSRPRNSFFM